jgi:hypothetical protein
MIALATPVVSGRAHGDGITIETGGPEPMRLTATLVVNAAGLDAQAVARAIDGLPPDKVPPLFSPRETTFRSPFARRFPGLSIRCRRQAASASILRWTSPGRRGLDRTSNGVETIDYDVDPRRVESF